MPDYAKMYHTLFSETTKAIEILQSAQQAAEEIYLSGEEIVFELLPEGGKNESSNQ